MTKLGGPRTTMGAGVGSGVGEDVVGGDVVGDRVVGFAVVVGAAVVVVVVGLEVSDDSNVNVAYGHKYTSAVPG